jgi:RND family efflux transporter MFP subunit
VAAARQGVATAEADLAAARANLAATRDAVAAAQAGVSASRAAVAAAEADRRTLAAGPREEAVAVARERVDEAESALAVAREQARDARVIAPFSGTITEILAEPGASVTQAGGVVRLVQTSRLEIEADVDENNLADLRVGQRAVITSTTFRSARLEGRIREIGAQVDVTRGTVEVKIVPESVPAWLRPGLTVDVNLIVNEAAKRLVIPRTAVRRQGESSVVIVPENGVARARPVILGAVEGEVVPVLEGVEASDRVARYADRVQPGARVKE